MSIEMVGVLGVLMAIAVVCGFIFTLYKVELLEKEITDLRTGQLHLNKKVEEENLRMLERIGTTQNLVDESLDHSHEVLVNAQEVINADKELLDKLKKVIKDNTDLKAQARDILNNNIEICEMCEELKESCQKLLQASGQVDVTKGDAEQ